MPTPLALVGLGMIFLGTVLVDMAVERRHHPLALRGLVLAMVGMGFWVAF